MKLAHGKTRPLRGAAAAGLMFLLLALAAGARAGEAREARDSADDPALEARVMQVASELRCLVCQNQTIADSHAGLAVDLRREIRSLLAQGRSEAEVREFMTQRYGDFVLYRPPVDARTWLLWFGPLALLATAAGGLWLHLRGRAARPDSDFESDGEGESAAAAERGVNP